MSAGEYDHPISWCFTYQPKPGMGGTATFLAKAWGHPSDWARENDGIRAQVFDYAPNYMACELHKRLYEERNRT